MIGHDKKIWLVALTSTGSHNICRQMKKEPGRWPIEVVILHDRRLDASFFRGMKFAERNKEAIMSGIRVNSRDPIIAVDTKGGSGSGDFPPLHLDDELMNFWKLNIATGDLSRPSVVNNALAHVWEAHTWKSDVSRLNISNTAVMGSEGFFYANKRICKALCVLAAVSSAPGIFDLTDLSGNLYTFTYKEIQVKGDSRQDIDDKVSHTIRQIVTNRNFWFKAEEWGADEKNLYQQFRALLLVPQAYEGIDITPVTAEIPNENKDEIIDGWDEDTDTVQPYVTPGKVNNAHILVLANLNRQNLIEGARKRVEQLKKIHDGAVKDNCGGDAKVYRDIYFKAFHEAPVLSSYPFPEDL